MMQQLREAGIRTRWPHQSSGNSAESSPRSLASPDPTSMARKASNPNKTGEQHIDVHSNPHPGEPFFTSDIYKGYKGAPLQGIAASRGPYFEHVMRLSNEWPRLRYLIDFMQCSTSPKRASLVPLSDILRRQSVVKVGVVNFTDPHAITVQNCGSISQLLDQLGTDRCTNSQVRRLFVVEDLSSPVIEALGSAFDIDPRFFRDHIEDHTWYNITDDWVEMPELRSRFQNRSFMTFRYLEPRFFDHEHQAKCARDKTATWNVLRRLDFQGQVKSGTTAWWESSPHLVGLLRRKTSIWTKSEGPGWTGVVLLDPHLPEGYPLWNGYGSLESPPSMSSPAIVHNAKGLSPFDALLRRVTTNSAEELEQLAEDPESITSKVYPFIFGDTLVTLQYAFTGLFQIEWELDAQRKRRPENLDRALDSLHKWQRRLPFLASYLADGVTCFEGRYALGVNIYSDSPRRHDLSQLVVSPDGKGKWQSDIWRDFISLLTKVDSLQSRADRIMGLANAVMSVEETRRMQMEGRNMSRITYLAFVFVPMTFVSSFLSMNNELSSRSISVYVVFFSVAAPMTLIALVVAANWNAVSVWWERPKGVK
ncbi:hypothetical protein JX266_013558 [Neoarthrinium moseri]|nr:hypothetical protein JX266_013558 [Neoarthrinium moseri]